MSLEVNFNIVKQSSLGDEMDEAECQQIASIMQAKQLKDGEILVPEGGSDNTLYLLAEGSLVVTTNLRGTEKLVYTMKPGECPATRAFVDKAPRKATLRANGPTVVYSLQPDPFETLLDSPHPAKVQPVCRDYLLRENELLHAFLSLKIVLYQEVEDTHHGEAAFSASLVGIKRH